MIRLQARGWLFVTQLAIVATATAQVPPGYEVVILSESPNGFHSIPDINNHGSVVFSIQTMSAADMFVFEDGILRKLAVESPYAEFPAINNNGVIAFQTGDILFGPYNPAVHSEGDVQLLAVDMNVIPPMDINDSGVVVWSNNYSQTGSHAELFMYDGASVVQLTSNGLSNQWPHINSSDQVVYTAINFSQSPDVSTVFLYDDGITTALSDSQWLSLDPVINDAGQVTWRKRLPDGFDFIILWENGLAMEIAQGRSIDAVGNPRISALGHIMFSRWNNALQQLDVWLWTPTELRQIPDYGKSAAQGHMNDRDEGAWRASNPTGPGTSVQLLRRVAPPGDFDHDCHRDLHDFAILERCLTAPTTSSPSAECARADLDQDGDLDEQDLAEFLATMTGPQVSLVDCIE